MSLLPTRPRTGRKAKDLAKDCTLKAKAKAKVETHKAKAKAKDLKNVLKDSSRPRPRPRTTSLGVDYLKLFVSLGAENS